eukprot:GHVL01011185.1.p1 GENE.GHVL01011185.1~~GHVL01011185.1.p1  ORF type:complete len:134 (+),score=17.21 GHVL01011185.1:251-652(+)
MVGGREVRVFNGENDILMVQDGPMVQPLNDYFYSTGKNETWDEIGSSSVLHSLPIESRLTFNNSVGQSNERMAAMRIASNEAAIREADARKTIQNSTHAMSTPHRMSLPGANFNLANDISTRNWTRQVQTPKC